MIPAKLTGIVDIDCLILSHIDEDGFFLHDLCYLNSYLISLYESNDLWTLKIDKLCPGLVIPISSNVKELYYLIKNCSIDALFKHSVKNNYITILDWIIKHYSYDYEKFFELITVVCRYGNSDTVNYFFKNILGVPKEQLSELNIEELGEVYSYI